jgi:hypothetical protein
VIIYGDAGATWRIFRIILCQPAKAYSVGLGVGMGVGLGVGSPSSGGIWV